jgi:hypothetical protein
MPRGKRVHVKKKMQGASKEDANMLNQMFSQMTGEGNADPDIIIPKTVRMIKLVKKYASIYTLLLNFKGFVQNFPEYKRDFDDIKAFTERLVGLSEADTTEKALNALTPDEVNKLYKIIKSSADIKAIVITSGNLGVFKRYLEDSANLRDEFIKREPGLSLTPLKFAKLDLKQLWASEKMTTMSKKYVLSIISHTYIIGHEIYQIITSPDIDIKKFSQVLVKNIDKMKKQIPRCDKAFDVIAKSVTMLENKFEGYYKNSVEAENPSIIIESFIIDVSMSQKANASITSQFRKIIMFVKRQTANNKDPRVAKMFKVLNSQFNMMQNDTGFVDDDSDDDKEEEEDSLVDTGIDKEEEDSLVDTGIDKEEEDSLVDTGIDKHD